MTSHSSRLRSLFSTAIVATALLMAAPPEAAAGGTQRFEVSDFAELDKGEVDGAAIEGSGKVSVGFLPARSDAPGTVAFSCLARGKDLFVGTADAATVQRVSLRGKKAQPKLSQLAKLKGVVVTAMAPLSGGDLAVATIPGGTVYRVNRKGKVSELVKLKVDQIWALRVHKGRLLAATGPKGELYSIGLDGKGAKVILDVDEKDLLSLLTVKDDILVGTAPRAKLYQVAKEQEGVLLHDFSGDEVRALATTKTGLVVAVNEFKDRNISSVDALSKNLNRTSLVGQPPTGTRSSTSPPKAEAAVYHVNLGPKRDLARASEATWETWLEKEKQYFTSVLALDDRGTVLVGSSDSGKVYRLRGLRDVSTVADFDERQTTSLCQLARGPVLATTGDGAAVYRLRAAAATKARYLTEVFDAKQPASFGAVRLRGKGPLKVRARSGPSDEPDKRWSSWKTIKVGSQRDGFRGKLVGVPHRRYVQLEVQLADARAELRDLDLFYAPENLAPVLKEVDIDHPDFDGDDAKEPDPEVTIKWKVDARDDDDLLFEVRVRPEGGDASQWIKLHDDTKLLTKKTLKWDATSVPDGVYEAEIRASDEPTNGIARARTDELVSAPFVVDHTRPSLTDTSVSQGRVRGQARDEASYIHDVAFSVDGGPFRAASPSDGLFDEKVERFEVRLPKGLKKGKHRVVIRARDAFGNIGAAALIVQR